ncbi:MFS transporter [Wenjunlia tyrosinilytica]|nr:MFS transporter [Wenjunlia tyrosinilytica]
MSASEVSEDKRDGERGAAAGEGECPAPDGRTSGRLRWGPGPLTVAGGHRYALALVVDALGAGLLRPFLLLYGISVLGMRPGAAGLAMSAGMLAGLVMVPLMGRWIDRGARSKAVAATLVVRTIGTGLLLLTHGPAGFTTAAVLLGIGSQTWPTTHAAMVATLTEGRTRDAALAAGRSLRNAGLGAGALLATLAMAGGAGTLRALAMVTGVAGSAAAVLVWSMRVEASAGGGRAGAAGAVVRKAAGGEARKAAGAEVRKAAGAAVPEAGGAAVPRRRGSATRERRGSAESTTEDAAVLRRITLLSAANLPYAFCFDILEVALPALLVTSLHASPAWSSGIFVGNTVLVITTQLAVVVRLAGRARRVVLAWSGVVLAASYLGFWAAAAIGGPAGAVTVAAVSVLYTAGEILYAGTGTALVVACAPPHLLGRALARWEISTGTGRALAPATLTALLATGPGSLWCALAAATLLSAAAIVRLAPKA